MANETIVRPDSANDLWRNYVTGGVTSNGGTNLGYDSGFSSTVRCALRFDNIAIPKNSTVNSAGLHIRADFRYGSSSVYGKAWGVDEDDTPEWSSHPFGRTKTTASNTHNQNVSAGQYWTIGVESIVNEIVARGGWSSGNAIGFVVEDNGTSTSATNSFNDNYGYAIDSYFHYRVSAVPNFKPTPKSVTAPSLPDTDSYGIKISKPGVSVLDANEAETYFTTRKQQFKVYDEGYLAPGTTSPVTVSHGLGYIPFVTLYQSDSVAGGGWKRLPRANYFSYDYAVFYVDSSNLTITPPSNNSIFYYYIFGEEIS